MTRAPIAARLARLTLLAPSCLAAFALAACEPGPVTYPLQVIETTTFAPSLGVDLAASTKQPSGVYYRDLVLGTGTAITDGAQVDVHYTGALYDGTVFDSNTGNATPLRFHYAAGQLIAGFDHGLAGVKAGGTRQLVIPSSQGYGAAGYPPKIPGNAILVFTVTVVAVQ